MRRRILLIDDTAVLAKSIAEMLEMEEFTVQVCHTGGQALLFLRDNTVDLVVSDLRMPEMDGLEVTKRIRNTERLKNIPVIIITADTNKENEKLSKDAGANLLLHKPFDEEYFFRMHPTNSHKMTNKIKVAIVDDQTLMRDALAASLQQVDDIQVIGTFSSGEEVVSKFRSVNPDVIVMDIIMKGMTGIEATRWLKERNAEIKIILLSGEVKKEFVKAGIQSGIDGYLPKDVDKETLLKAIRAVVRGERFFNEAITTLVFEDFYQKEKVTFSVGQQLKGTDLTKRELEVFRLIANGKSNKEVGDELFISVKTVDTHKTHILDKLGLKNTAEMVKYAIRNKLISED